MAMFEKFRDKALNLAEAGMSKAKEMGEITKLNLANASEEEAMKKTYAEIGKICYAATSANPDAAYADLFQKIAESKAKIELNKAKIAEIKADGEDCDCPEEEVPPEEPTEPKE